MTGDEHYTEAEKLLKLAEMTSEQDLAGYCNAQSQVHATLALAAFAREDHPAGPGPYTGVGL